MPRPSRLISLLAIPLILLLAGVVAAQDQVTLVVNTVVAAPIPDEAAYQVTAYVTVTDADGQPIGDLTADAFAVSQDGTPVELDSASIAERPVSVLLVLDTSGSMLAEGKIEAVKSAATSFVNGLNAGDQIGVIYFNDQVQIAQNLSDDHRAALTIIDLLAAVDGAGTCLYDAAYTAITAASAAPAGQRAIILLTDGIDETPSGSPCSEHTLQQVIDHANEASTRVPIYTIGVGTRAKPEELQDIADSTGGSAFTGGDAASIDGLFAAISALLKNQYALVYETQTTSGEHTLTITATVGGATAVGSRSFIAPDLLPILTLSGLDDGAILSGSQTVRATVSGRGEIASVTFTLNGEPLAEVTAAPFEVGLTDEDLEAGSHQLSATATLADGSQITRTLAFEVRAAPTGGESGGPEPGPQTGEETGAGEEEESAAPTGLPWWAVAAGGGVVLLIAGVVVALVLRKPPAPKGQIIGGGATLAGSRDTLQARAAIPALDIAAAFGTLHVEESLSLHRGQKFELHGDLVRIGRGAENDVIIPDAPVSRNHAEIRLMPDGLRRLFDLGSTYGSFVNDEKCGPDGLPFEHGDRLQFGTRTIARFEVAFMPVVAGADDRTMDIAGGSLGEEMQFATTPLHEQIDATQMSDDQSGDATQVHVDPSAAETLHAGSARPNVDDGDADATVRASREELEGKKTREVLSPYASAEPAVDETQTIEDGGAESGDGDDRTQMMG